MNLDDPTRPELASWRSYYAFARRVRHTRRYVWDDHVQAFLDTVLATLKNRDEKIRQGTLLYRAQRGVQYETVMGDDGNEIGEETRGFGPKRMIPRTDRAK